MMTPERPKLNGSSIQDSDDVPLVSPTNQPTFQLLDDDDIEEQQQQQQQQDVRVPMTPDNNNKENKTINHPNKKRKSSNNSSTPPSAATLKAMKRAVRRKEVNKNQTTTKIQNQNEEKVENTMSTTTPVVDCSNWRLLPWYDWTEWLQMRQLLKQNKPHGAQRLLNVFAMRRRGVIPIAMSASVALVSLLSQRHQQHSQQAQRLGLAMAITRLVNGFTDSAQPHDIDKRAKSVANTALQFHMPPTLVDIRHQATHAELPCVDMLQDAARQALVWLDAFYWQPQYDQLLNKELISPTVEEVRNTFVNFSSSHIMSVYDKEEKEDQNDNDNDDYDGDDGDEKNKYGKRREKLYTKASVALAGIKEQKDDSVAVLKRLRKCIGQTQNEKKMARVLQRTDYGKNAMDGVQVLASRGGAWEECGDHEKWRYSPIGLIPGQHRVPLIPIDALVSKNEMDDDEYGDNESADVNLNGNKNDEIVENVVDGGGIGGDNDDTTTKKNDGRKKKVNIKKVNLGVVKTITKMKRKQEAGIASQMRNLDKLLTTLK